MVMATAASSESRKKAAKRFADGASDGERKKKLKTEPVDMSPDLGRGGSSIKQEPTSPSKSSQDHKKKTRTKKEPEPEPEVWKWWEEEPRDDGVRWKTLVHAGPLFAPPYERIPAHVKFIYDGAPVDLSEEAEEVAGFYAKMLDHDYTSKEAFNKNFFRDWRSVMTSSERKQIKQLTLCDFTQMAEYFKGVSERNKAASKEEKQAKKAANKKLDDQFGWCTIDGHRQKIANFRVEPPGLFRGRGEHPKMGTLKRRLMPEDIIINVSEGNAPDPPPGHHWKKVQSDPTVSWLANWIENVQSNGKYIMLNAASKFKGEKDYAKYEKARKLANYVDKIRETYQFEFKSKEMRIRQRAVALYLIDKLALRAGGEKDDEEADTVGCCSLRVEHVTLHRELEGKEYVLELDFLGKDSIRYHGTCPVERQVFKNLKLFVENKQPENDLFDRLNTSTLNAHLQSLMPGLSAKVFRTFNASKTLEEQLLQLTNSSALVAEKVLAYNRANRAVAILCNHQRAVPKNFSQQMENLATKLKAKKEVVSAAKEEARNAKEDYKTNRSVQARQLFEKKKAKYCRLQEQYTKLKVAAVDKDENKEIALGTSKLNYLDPRISVAWCMREDVPLEKVYSKTHRQKFQWAIEMTKRDFRFIDTSGATQNGNAEDDDDVSSDDE